MTARDGGVFRNTTSSEAGDQGRREGRARPRTERLREGTAAAARQRPPARASAWCPRRRLVLRDTTRRARASLRDARAFGVSRGRSLDRVAEADVVRRDRSLREHRA